MRVAETNTPSCNEGTNIMALRDTEFDIVFETGTAPDGDWVRWVCLCGAQGDKVVNQAEATLDAGYHFMDCH